MKGPMKKLLTLCIVSFSLASCGSSTLLYHWGGFQKGTTTYENLNYRNLEKQTPECICKLLCMYEDMVTNPGGVRMVPPPGICAEYGYMLLNPENAELFSQHATAQQKKTYPTTDYASYFAEKGKEMMNMEIELYPVSAKFITPMIERLCK